MTLLDKILLIVENIVVICVMANNCFRAERQELFGPKCIDRASMRIQEGKR